VLLAFFFWRNGALAFSANEAFSTVLLVVGFASNFLTLPDGFCFYRLLQKVNGTGRIAI
jgi:hypothetical protein